MPMGSAWSRSAPSSSSWIPCSPSTCALEDFAARRHACTCGELVADVAEGVAGATRAWGTAFPDQQLCPSPSPHPGRVERLGVGLRHFRRRRRGRRTRHSRCSSEFALIWAELPPVPTPRSSTRAPVSPVCTRRTRLAGAQRRNGHETHAVAATRERGRHPNASPGRRSPVHPAITSSSFAARRECSRLTRHVRL